MADKQGTQRSPFQAASQDNTKIQGREQIQRKGYIGEESKKQKAHDDHADEDGPLDR